MSEVKLDFSSAGGAAVQQQLDKLTKGLAAAREENRKLSASAREGKAATDSWSAGMQRLHQQNDRWANGMKRLSEMQPKRTVVGLNLDSLHQATSGLGQMVGSLVGIGTAVGVATMAYGKWQQKVDEIIQGHTDLSMAIVKTLAESGKLQLGPQVEKWAKGQSGATPGQAMSAIAGVMQSGETLSNERTMGVATEIAKLAPTGIDLTRTGALAADVADISGEGTSAEDVADITVGMKQQLREKADLFSGPKFQKQVEHLKRNKKLSGEDALAYAMVALQSEGGAEAMNVASMRPGDRSLDQRKMYREVFTSDAISEAKTKIQGFKQQNLATGELNALGEFQAGREAKGEQRVSEEKAKTQEQYGPLESERRRILKTIESRAWNKSYFRGAAETADQYIGEMNSLVAGRQGTAEASIRGAQGQGLITSQEAQQMIAALREAAAASREVAKKNRPNVDAHTE